MEDSTGISAMCFREKWVESSDVIDISTFSGSCQIEHFFDILLKLFTNNSNNIKLFFKLFALFLYYLHLS